MAKTRLAFRVAICIGIVWVTILQYKVEISSNLAIPDYLLQLQRQQVVPVALSDYGPMLELIELSGERVDKGMLKNLPTWSKVTEIIGSDKPIIFGLDKCPSFDKDEMILAAAGIFNSGTNNLYQLLKNNCEIRSAKYIDKFRRPQLRVRWQTPWGKHEVAAMRSRNMAEMKLRNPTYKDNNWSHETILPVVTIRDPYTWMQSMCRKGYRADWFRTDQHCPNLVPTDLDRKVFTRLKTRKIINFKTDKVKIRGGYSVETGFHGNSSSFPVHLHFNSINATYPSMAHLWSEWYNGYARAEFPSLLVRAEDLIFFPEQVTRKVCECAGGKMKEKFSLVQEDLKTKHFLSAKESRDMSSMMIRYGSGTNRTKQMTKDDLEYAKIHLDSALMKMYGYHHLNELEPSMPNAPSTSQTKQATQIIKSKPHQPLIDLLYLAGQKVSNSDLNQLPHWDTVTSVIGASRPIIFGLEQCSSLNQQETILAVAGLFNSGTSHLYSLLHSNCDIKSEKYTNKMSLPQERLRMQVPWGVHELATMRGRSKPRFLDNNWNLKQVLPVVTIRDPYTWMQSLCQNAFDLGLHWFSTDKHCPSLVPTETDRKVHGRMKSRKFVHNPNKRNDEVRVLSGSLDDAGFRPDNDEVPIKVQYHSINITYVSIVEFWNEWYGSYQKANFPKLIIRAEDLIFFPEEVTRQVCECAGGKMRTPFSFAHKSPVTLDKMIEYGSGTKRTRHMTSDDLAYAKQNLDSELIQIYGYQHPDTSMVEAPTSAPIPKFPKRLPQKPKQKMVVRNLIASTVDKEPLITLLRHAGELFTDADVERLPTWSKVKSLIGDKPIIHGLEHCSSFNQSEAILAVAGMLNTGTNLMYSLLRANCNIFSSIYTDKRGFAERRVRWQVNWGKHELPKFRYTHDIAKDFNYDIDDIIPVVTTRDPYSWMQSMCRSPYVAGWFYTNRHCPNLILTREDRDAHARFIKWIRKNKRLKKAGIKPNPYTYTKGEPRILGGMGKYGAPIPTNETVPLTMHFHSVNMTFTTIADLWNTFYREYNTDSHPSLFVRAEDLIFFPREVTTSICQCAGGKIYDTNNFNYVSESLKPGFKDNRHSLVNLLVRYGSAEARTTQMTVDDLAYAKYSLDNDLMDFYGYRHPDVVAGL